MPTDILFSRRSFILMSLSLAACKGGADILELSGSTMGTGYSVTAVDHDRRVDKAALQKAIGNSLESVNATLSNWDPTSEVSRFNAWKSSEPMQVSEDLAKVVQTSKDVNHASEGQFDITLGPVIEAWGFGAKKPGRHAEPAAAILSAAKGAAGQTDGLNVGNGSLRKTRPETQIYVPSVGKGYGVDKLAEVVRSFGLSDFMVEIGGDIYVSGLNADGMEWQIGIESPNALSRQAFKVASVSNLGMATSGDYRNYFEHDGQRYSHIIDAHAGRPIIHKTASVTVLAENTMMADAWSTALLAAGTERGLAIANQRDLAVMFIDRNTDAPNGGFVTAASNRFKALQA